MINDLGRVGVVINLAILALFYTYLMGLTMAKSVA